MFANRETIFMKVIVTCEHGGNQIPPKYQPYFQFAKERLKSHEGWDIGAMDLAKAFAEQFADYYFFTEISRLLVEVNSSIGRPRLFSSITKPLDTKIKEELLSCYYFPYRRQVSDTIGKCITKNNVVLHLSVHSFTSILKQKERLADVGLLYVPYREEERKFCGEWKKNIVLQSKNIKIRLNYPYLGKSDSLVTALRKSFPSNKYIGVELEVNQKFMKPQCPATLTHLLLSTFKATLFPISY
jgi:predicted N-formylglutamate amidohydrolase